MFGKFRKSTTRSTKSSPESRWHPEQRHLDTVVFVHGVLGNHKSTWGKFFELLCEDPDLPKLDILSWGYKSSLVPGSYLSVEQEGDALVSDLDLLIRKANDIFLVGHSMGGLVILKGIVNEREKSPPQAKDRISVKRIVLYASPLNGSEVANVVVFAMARLRIERLLRWFFPMKQARDLTRDGFCERLMQDCRRLICTESAEGAAGLQPIVVRACAAKRDRLVSIESAKGIFSNPIPRLLEGDHVSIKLPESLNDIRYQALRSELVAELAHSFHRLCSGYKSSDRSVRLATLQRFDMQYGDMVRRCAEVCVGRKAVTESDLSHFAKLLLEAAALGPTEPAQLVARIVCEYKYRDDKRACWRS